jgi:hypothetical protein
MHASARFQPLPRSSPEPFQTLEYSRAGSRQMEVVSISAPLLARERSLPGAPGYSGRTVKELLGSRLRSGSVAQAKTT